MEEAVPTQAAQDQTINLVNPDGALVSVPLSQGQEALARFGYRQPTQSDVQNYQDKQSYGEGITPAVKAFGAGAARAGTFGLSDEFLVHKMGVNPSTLENLRKYQPTATGAGEIAGIGAGVLLAPEAEGVAAAKTALRLAEGAGTAADITAAKMALNAARASENALGASDLINPVSAVSKIGQGITAGFTPEATTLAGQIASKAMGGALGSGIEGAAYGLGNAVSEDALGDPNALGEKLLANVTHGALLGGALGGALHGAMAPFVKEDITTALDSVGPVSSAESVPGAIEGGAFTKAEKDQYQNGLKQLKSDAKETQDSANILGVGTYPGQLSDSNFVQKSYSMATQSPSTAGVKEANLIHQDFKNVAQKVDETLGQSTNMSEKELGDSVRQGMIDQVKKDIAPLNEAYDRIAEYRQGTPLSAKAQSQVGKNIIKDESIVTASGKALNAEGPSYQLAKKVSEKLQSGDLVTVDDLARYKSSLRQDFGKNPDVSHIYGVIQEKLTNLETKWLDEMESQMKTPEAKLNVANFRSALKETNSKYASFKEDLSSLGSGIGKGKIRGAQDMVNFLEDLEGSKLGARITRDRPEFIQFLKERFPAQFEQVKNFQKSEIRNSSHRQLETGSMVDPNAVLKNIDKLSKEAKNAYFSQEEIKTLKAADQWLSSWGKKWGPSGTPQGVQYLTYFLSPKLGLAMEIKDRAALHFAKKMVGSVNAPAQVAGLTRLERMAQETTNQIKSYSKAIFESSSTAAGAYAGLSKNDNSPEVFEERKKRISEDANNPEAFLNKIDESTRLLHKIAPKAAGALQQSAATAVQFLHSKLPVSPPPKPFSKPFQTSKSDIDTFNRYYNTVENPSIALKEIRGGTLTPEHIETLHVVMPMIYNEMKQEILGHLAELPKDKEIPYPRKVALSLFLGQDLDDSLEQPMISQNQMALQINQANEQMANAVKTTQTGLSKITKSKRLMTPLQETAEREA